MKLNTLNHFMQTLKTIPATDYVTVNELQLLSNQDIDYPEIVEQLMDALNLLCYDDIKSDDGYFKVDLIEPTNGQQNYLYAADQLIDDTTVAPLTFKDLIDRLNRADLNFRNATTPMFF